MKNPKKEVFQKKSMSEIFSAKTLVKVGAAAAFLAALLSTEVKSAEASEKDGKTNVSEKTDMEKLSADFFNLGNIQKNSKPGENFTVTMPKIPGSTAINEQAAEKVQTINLNNEHINERENDLNNFFEKDEAGNAKTRSIETIR